jgi:hypothetical protein
VLIYLAVGIKAFKGGLNGYARPFKNALNVLLVCFVYYGQKAGFFTVIGLFRAFLFYCVLFFLFLPP